MPLPVPAARCAAAGTVWPPRATCGATSRRTLDRRHGVGAVGGPRDGAAGCRRHGRARTASRAAAPVTEAVPLPAGGPAAAAGPDLPLVGGGGAAADDVAADRRRLWVPAVAVVVAQITAGLVAHSLAHGCPPGLAATLAVLPAAASAVATVDRVLARRSAATRLAGGQAAVHLVLALLLSCSGPAGQPAGGHAHAGQASPGDLLGPLAMTAAHAAAIWACAVLVERVERGLDRTADLVADVIAAVTGALVGRAQLPALAGPAAGAAGVRTRPLAAQAWRLAHGTRGPPALLP